MRCQKFHTHHLQLLGHGVELRRVGFDDAMLLGDQAEQCGQLEVAQRMHLVGDGVMVHDINRNEDRWVGWQWCWKWVVAVSWWPST